MSCCPVCELLGEDKIKGVDRLRGFELEFSMKQLEKLTAPAMCANHLRKCGGECQQRLKAGEECNCKICSKEKGIKEKPVCPGHPCLQAANGRMEYQTFLTEVVKKAGVPHRGNFADWARTPKNNNFFDLKTDSSCGYEIATPPMRGNEVRKTLEPLLNELKKVEELHKGWRMQDDSCGLHCTIDVGDQGLRGVKRILLAMARHQWAMLGTQPKYRWANRNCQKFGETYLGTVGQPGFKRQVTYVQVAGGLAQVVPDKHFILNTAKYQGGEGLLEFRFGGASIDIDQIEAYGVMVECLVQAAIERPAVAETDDRKKRFFLEIIRPYMSDPRVEKAWGILGPVLEAAQLPIEKAIPKKLTREQMNARGWV